MNFSRRLRINSPKVAYEIFDDEVIIIHFESGNYYSLDKIGAVIWSFIESGVPVGAIVEGMKHRYTGTQGIIEDTVSQLLDELEQEGLIVPAEGDGAERQQEPTADAATRPEPEKLPFDPPLLQRYTDMQDMLLLDPIHEVDENGWPTGKPGAHKRNE
jgi:hypothetical protein